MDPQKEKALKAVHDGRTYDVNGIPCTTAAEVNAAWKAESDAETKPAPRKWKKVKPSHSTTKHVEPAAEPPASAGESP